MPRGRMSGRSLFKLEASGWSGFCLFGYRSSPCSPPSLPEPAGANPKGCRGSVRHFIFDLFLNQMTDQASQFMEEITPCMININRRIAKDLTL